MPREDVRIATKDGECPTAVFTPSGAGPWPAVIFYMDGLAIRPTLHVMGQRLADAGYVVLVPDMFYRAGPYDPLNPKEVFAANNFRQALGHLMGSTDNKRAAEDTGAFLGYIDSRKDVLGKKVGVTGYCMGGAIALTAAGTYPDRIAAAASFHGGNLASDAELSPHRLVPSIKAFVCVGAADNDASYPPEMAGKLVTALSEAHVAHRHELYQGALHGWTMTDFPIYNEAAAERHWRELIALYKATLH